MKKYKIEATHLQKMKELKMRKDGFNRWKLALDMLDELPLADSLKLFKE